MNARFFDRKRTIAIILGAHFFKSGKESAPAFLRSAVSIFTYLFDEEGLGLDPTDVRYLFDDPRAPDEQVHAVFKFIEDRKKEKEISGVSLEAVLIFFVGHGIAPAGDNVDLSLRVYADTALEPLNRGINFKKFAETVLTGEQRQRIVFVIDCCFSGKAGSILNEIDPFNQVLLLASCTSGSVSRVNEKKTLFTGSMIEELRTSRPVSDRVLSFAEVEFSTYRRMSQSMEEAPTPKIFVFGRKCDETWKHHEVVKWPAFPARTRSLGSDVLVENREAQHSDTGSRGSGLEQGLGERGKEAGSGMAEADATEHRSALAPGRIAEAGRKTPTRDGDKPVWAHAVGTDGYGCWADIKVWPVGGGEPLIQRLRKIPADSFQMGTDGGNPDEGPPRQVQIERAFWLFATPCTQRLWEAVMGENPSAFKNEDRPVERVSWYDVQEFLTRLNVQNESFKLRLPTEAEWEYACRAGQKDTSDIGKPSDVAKLGEIAWYGDNSHVRWGFENAEEAMPTDGTTRRQNERATHAVGKKAANGWGLYDMLGNVCEWCEDHWHPSYKGTPPMDGTAWIDETAGAEPKRVIRGGSWLSRATQLRPAYRDVQAPNSRLDTLGFRCARDTS